MFLIFNFTSKYGYIEFYNCSIDSSKQNREEEKQEYKHSSKKFLKK
ncbi:1194_t:CDS:2 [Racocetra persica]|uniref:1194_t:CDS:1 n=1 Tax=Racocetra persica TaxID=160502 RepID=A0ACA9KHI1_9GLOM|nr:1194_t:CDS:2 [Racocetra persica]